MEQQQCDLRCVVWGHQHQWWMDDDDGGDDVVLMKKPSLYFVRFEFECPLYYTP